MDRIALDVAHMFAGGLVLVSFMLLYQDRMFSLINIFALHAFVVSASVAWQAYIQNAPHLYVTAAIALVVKAIVIPIVLHRIIVRLGIHRNIETVVGIGQIMLGGIGLVALSILVMLPITAEAGTLAREDLAFALSVILLGLLIMVSRRNAVGQVIGFMWIENGLILAATGAKGMPLVVEIMRRLLSILVALIVIGIFLFRIQGNASIPWTCTCSTASAGSGHERAQTCPLPGAQIKKGRHQPNSCGEGPPRGANCAPLGGVGAV